VRDIGLVQTTDRILVSGAAGGVGSHVADIAKALGAREVVGIAGGPEKCRRLQADMRYNRVIDYKNENMTRPSMRPFPMALISTLTT
jgi:NADPH-dependent curcumin reductase CurA